MTGSKCLPDTSVIIHTFRENNVVSAQLDAVSEVYVPLTVIGELFYGAYRSAEPVKHINRMQLFINNCIVLQPDSKTADIYGSIKAALMKKGKPIPENDIWIAAIAQQYNLQLFTTDKHFAEVESIALFGT
ncbi:twitching motility protein PilT [Flavihumibacter stibioxidans]|uniref:Twitching motility protein PilT n=1 Tax=Flavihumibacter stibioxidans TaxID=1834163 RepID=A0ABR7M7Q1_9BACT|nr:type II toxin-antitoxin system VapC family toxin [Flavihumibacter stibioxidans]MBC6490641.1 twitching motility protein PilT [Flavihumibacter stibioxidans]MBC6490714.1 twitching motility protein PilT [Flavihumibacter stibioxidans]MBC6491557.1 twitching motility protein PilT [Flavihumibacter stibioxidans]MBC6493056.1 twitching motility protein PilT [Flavihumibacter stibioxidans]